MKSLTESCKYLGSEFHVIGPATKRLDDRIGTFARFIGIDNVKSPNSLQNICSLIFNIFIAWRAVYRMTTVTIIISFY